MSPHVIYLTLHLGNEGCSFSTIPKEKENFVIELSYDNCKLVSGGDSEFVQCMDQNWGNNTFVGGVSGAIAGAVGGAGVLSLPGAVAGGILGIVGGSTGTGAYCGVRSIFKSMLR